MRFLNELQNSTLSFYIIFLLISLIFYVITFSYNFYLGKNIKTKYYSCLLISFIVSVSITLLIIIGAVGRVKMEPIFTNILSYLPVGVGIYATIMFVKFRDKKLILDACMSIMTFSFWGDINHLLALILFSIFIIYHLFRAFLAIFNQYNLVRKNMSKFAIKEGLDTIQVGIRYESGKTTYENFFLSNIVNDFGLNSQSTISEIWTKITKKRNINFLNENNIIIIENNKVYSVIKYLNDKDKQLYIFDVTKEYNEIELLNKEYDEKTIIENDLIEKNKFNRKNNTNEKINIIQTKILDVVNEKLIEIQTVENDVINDENISKLRKSLQNTVEKIVI